MQIFIYLELRLTLTYWRNPHMEDAVYSHLLLLAGSRGSHPLYVCMYSVSDTKLQTGYFSSHI